MQLLAAISLLAITASAAPSASEANLAIRAAAAPPPEANVRVRGFTYGGNGCPQGSMEPSADSTGMPTYRFQNLVTEMGPSVPQTKNRLNCQMNLDILTDNYQYRLVGKQDVDPSYMEAHVRFDEGITAQYKNNYYFSGSSDQASVEYNITRGASREFDAYFPDPYTGFTTPWGPCGEGALNMNRQIRLINNVGDKSLTAYFELFQGPGYIPWALFEWRKCT